METTVAEAPSAAAVERAEFRPLFVPVHADDIGQHWPMVERGIDSILAKATREPWTARDVRRHLRRGKAQLFLRDDGFIVLERAVEPISGEPYLNVWLMWFAPGCAMPQLRDQIKAWLDDMKILARAEWWQFSSPREGWGAMLETCCERICSTWIGR